MVQGAEAKMKGSASESVKVVVRCRPMNEQETAHGYTRVVDMDVDRGVVELRNVKAPETDPRKTFTFDAVYDWNSKQLELYDETFRPLVDSVLCGFNGTIFAYGQTGTGKTYTMEGIRDDPDQRGVIPNSFEHIFDHIARSINQQYLIRASYLEIYQEEIRDLLGKDQKKRLELKERPDTGVYVRDLQQFVCKSVNEIQHVMTVGNQNRAVGATNMNLHSSRSHAIFIITIECSEIDDKGKNHIRVGKLNLVDLAGSERQSKTGTVGERLKEATKINLSLSALGNVISALVDGKSTHIPYRDSKLTRLLQDSLGGNSKTIMVANIGPASYNYDETITTLRYANRAKNIQNKPKVNEDPKDAILKEYQQELARLKAQLSQKGVKKKKKKKATDEGEEEEEEEEEEDADSEALLQQERELEVEKDRILNDQHMIEEQEKERYLTEIKHKEAEMVAAKDAQEKLLNRIKTMESKLLCGGKNIIDHTNEQQRALQQRKQEILEQKKREREMLQLLEKEEESSCEIASTFSSLQAEVEAKTRKLKKLFAKLQSVKQEMADLHEEFCRDRVDLQHTQNVLTRELKLKALIIENFISPEEKRKILSRAYFDEDEDVWKVRPVVRQTSGGTLKRPVSSASRRPTSEYAKMQASVDHNPRYKGENIMVVELDPAVRTTRDWEGPVVAPRVSAALEAALRPLDEDLNIDASLATLNHSQAVKSTRKTKGKLTPYDEIDAVIKNNKQTMSRIIPEIQEWAAPPYAVAGQFHVPKIPRSGSKVTPPKSWTPRGSVMHQDDYDEDPCYYSMTPQERMYQDSSFRESREHTDTEDANSNGLKKCSVISHSRNPSVSSRVSSSSEKSKGFSEAQLVDVEEFSVFNSQKGTRLILGPFGARRTCYHYRPQVKRCLTTVFKTSFRKVLLSCSCCSENQRVPVNCPHSSSRTLVCSEHVNSVNKKSCPKLSHTSKKCCLNRFCHHHVLTKSVSRLQMGSVTQKFSCLTRKKRLQWRATMRPCVYERVLWRLPSSLWKQLTLCLLNFKDDDLLHFLTPVMFSLRRFSGLSESRMVYSLSRDSYGVTERAWEDLVTALCLCCVLMFMYRVYGGIYGCLSEVMDWISW
ncbi:kinesin-like protein KIF3B isoform X1 [Macrobrachium rosenbergii]|uniref:kinesin-like protein KIF3B isoform X1 n=1 Tax=Macrobrachium rosenbergii TaxID=79674 RepID=UPI0034D5690D